MMSILGILAILLILVIIFQITRAGEQLSELKDEEAEQAMWDGVHAKLFLLFLVFGMVGAFYSVYAYADLFLPTGSVHGEYLDSMWFWSLAAILPIFVLTHILLFVFTYIYKYDKNRKAKYFPHDNRLELIWTLIPAIVMVFLVMEGMRNWLKITGPASEEALVIEATGEQFKWTLRFPGEDGILGKKVIREISATNPYGQDWDDTANEDDFVATTDIYLPVDREILVKINSHDVLHSFFLPQFQVKMDAVPGIPTRFKFTPKLTTKKYREMKDDPEAMFELACTELCGPSHWNMKRTFYVVEQEEYDAWAKEQEPYYKQMKAAEAAAKKSEKKAEQTAQAELDKKDVVDNSK